MQSSCKQLILGLVISMILVGTFFSGIIVQPIEVASCTRLAGIEVRLAGSSAPEWNKTYGGIESDIGVTSVQTADGGFTLAGRTYSFGAGSSDFWLVRTDANGNHLWNKTYGGIGSDLAMAFLQTTDGGYALTGPTYSFGAGGGDFWLVKTDAFGNHLWNQTYGGTGEERAYGLVQTADGGYALAGSTYSFGAGSSDFWLVRTDANGNHLWNKTYGGTSMDDPLALIQTADGGYALAGRTGSFGAGRSDFWLVKTDASGNHLWNKKYGGAIEDRVYALVQTADDGYVLAGYTGSYGAGGGDFWLVKTDVSGNPQWNRTYGGEGHDSPFALVQTADGGYALAGLTYSFGAGGSDIWLVKTDADGDVQWNQTYGGTDEDYAGSVVQMSDGGYALAGGTSSFGAGSDDFWLVRTLREVTTITVPDDYSTIQEAINNAIEGDVIFVRNGIYYEHVVVNKTVSLLGEGVSMTIVDGSGTGNVFAINKDSVNITGITVQNGGGILGNAGLRLDNASFCSISGNRIRDNFAGIWFESASDNQITANEITGNVDDGIVFNYSHNNTISENQIAFHEYFGIVINWSHNNTICYNNVTQTYGPSHGDGINLWKSSHNTISRNHVEENNRYGIRVEVQSNNNTISDNMIGNCLTGLQLYDSSNFNYVCGNNVAQCSDGIDINKNSTQNTVSNNTITDNEVCGLQVYSAEDNLIYGNDLRNNWAGIGAHGKSQYNSFDGNSIENCTNGVLLHDSDYNSMSGNSITDCEIAIHFEWLTNFNTAEENNIRNNHIGIQLEQTSGNIFCHNNILFNAIQVSIIEYASDTWDDGYPSGGNYWSDYSGIDFYMGPGQNDSGSDGIGDDPYVLDGNNVDRYPLVRGFSSNPADLNGDGKVDIIDLAMCSAAFGSYAGHAKWNPAADVDKDGKVDIRDLAIVAMHFGEANPRDGEE